MWELIAALWICRTQSWLTFVGSSETLLIHFEDSPAGPLTEINTPLLRLIRLSFLITKNPCCLFFFSWLKSICLSRLAFGQDLKRPIEVIAHYWPAAGSLLYWRYLGEHTASISKLFFTMPSKQLARNLLPLVTLFQASLQPQSFCSAKFRNTY